VSGVVDIPNACCALYLPTAIFDFDIRPTAEGPQRQDRGQRAVTSCPTTVPRTRPEASGRVRSCRRAYGTDPSRTQWPGPRRGLPRMGPRTVTFLLPTVNRRAWNEAVSGCWVPECRRGFVLTASTGLFAPS